jgi:hypothetical protein
MYDLLHALDIVLAGYMASTFIFLLIAIFSKKLKSQKNDYLNTANLIALPLTGVLSIITIFNFIEDYSSIKNDDFTYPFYIRHFSILLLTSGLIPCLYFSKKLRRKALITCIVIISINYTNIYERVFIFLTNLYRDYLPSSWSTVYDDSESLYISLATIFYFTLVYFIIVKMKKFKPNTPKDQ